VEAFPTECANHALHDRVRDGCMDWGGDGVDADTLSPLTEVTTVRSVPIVQQMPRLASPGCGLDHLPPDPGCNGIGGYIDMDQLAPSMGDEHQYVQRVEVQCRHREQVGCPQMVSVFAQKRPPRLSARPGWFTPA